jgi:protein-S-isoprenylcysteine O-methyltransferase Ste14
VDRTSRLYGTLQTTILGVFAVVTIWRPGPILSASSTVIAAGNALSAMGVVVLAAALFALRGTVQIEPAPKGGRELVQRGVYRFLRHPIYTGIVLCVTGLCLKAPSVAGCLAGLLVLLFLALKVRVEERYLLAAYPGYAPYRERTLGVFLTPRF